MATRDDDHRPTAWVLNLDADLELAAHGSYTPTNSIRAAMRRAVPVLARALLDEGDILVDEHFAGDLEGMRARAYCPTPRAIALLRRAGATPEPHPSLAVLRQVNSRAFTAGLLQGLPGARFVTDLRDAMAALATSPSVGRDWRAKRPFGMSGRGQRTMTPGALADADHAFLQSAMSEGGVQLEPNVTVVDEYALHGVVSQGGAATYGAMVAQRCDARGRWLETLPIEQPTDEDRDVAARLAEQCTNVASALAKAGYFGPFGVDAYTYRDADGGVSLQPLSEVNARYSMGFAIGFRDRGR